MTTPNLTDHNASAPPRMRGKVQEEIRIAKVYTLELTEEQVARIIKLAHYGEGGYRYPLSNDPNYLRITHELQRIFPEIYSKAITLKELSWEQWKENFK